MRLIALLPLVASMAAFILTMLVLFAGSSPGTLQDADLLTLNTSRLGQNFFQVDTTEQNTPDRDCDGLDLVDKARCLAGGVKDDVSDAASNTLTDVKGEISETLREGIGNLTRALNIHDFYSAHILNFCEGYYLDSTSGDDEGKNVTKCSNRTAMFHFDPKKILQEELHPGINLTDLEWPEEIDDAINAIRIASITMFVFYCIAAGFTGLSMIVAFVVFISGSRVAGLCEIVTDILAFISLVIASGISTAIIDQAVKGINKYGDDVGVAADKGDKFLGMTWAATALMLVSAITACVAVCCMGSDKPRRRYRKSSV